MHYNGEDVLEKRLEIRDNIAKSLGIEDECNNLEKARNVGDIHPNGKWVWKEYKPGKFDWRTIKGAGKDTPAKPQPKAEEKKEDKQKEPKQKEPKQKEPKRKATASMLDRAAKLPKTVMRTGLSIYPATENDRVAIENLIDNEGYTAEWNEEWGCYFFEEEPGMYDALEREIQAGLGHEINCTFEGE